MKTDYDHSIHSNPDSEAWTKFFREINPDCNVEDDIMRGWFANAMMAMHDHIYQTKIADYKQSIIGLIDEMIEVYNARLPLGNVSIANVRITNALTELKEKVKKL